MSKPLTAFLAWMRHIEPLRGAVMFEESLLESAHLLRTQNRWPAFASVALQAAVAATIIVIPLLRPAALSFGAIGVTLVPPAPTPPKPPQVQHTRVETSLSAKPTTQTLARPVINTLLDPTGFSNDPPPDGATINMASTAPAIPNALASTTASPHVSIAPKAGPLSISKGVSVGLLLAPILPIYPVIARSTRTEGTVTIHAIISKDGLIESANVVDGPPLLRGAALDAVRAAHYRPYLLNGQPTEVETTFSINFRLSS